MVQKLSVGLFCNSCMHSLRTYAGLIKQFATVGFNWSHLNGNFSSDGQDPLLSYLGYIVALLPVAAAKGDPFGFPDLLRLAGLNAVLSIPGAAYLPILASVEIAANVSLSS